MNGKVFLVKDSKDNCWMSKGGEKWNIQILYRFELSVENQLVKF